jgi:hypothetical protein
MLQYCALVVVLGIALYVLRGPLSIFIKSLEIFIF